MEKAASAGQELADRISLSLNAGTYEPGSIVGSEQDLREQHNASRALFRQAMRILEHRGIIRLRRGLGGGVIFVGQEDAAIARDLARLIESQTADVYDVWSLLHASDPLLFSREGPRITLTDSLGLRKVIASLEAMSQEEFARAMGHRTLHIAMHKLVKNDILLLTQRVAFEAGIDLFPSRWHIAAESARRDFWVVGLEFAESLVAQNMTGFVSARKAQVELLKAAFYTAKRQAGGRAHMRLFRPGSADWDLPEQGDGGFFNNRADFLVREILDEIRVRQWREGERLGTTRELIDRFGVSLPVLRQALRVLEESGAVRISRGRGGGLEIGAPSQSSTFDRAVEFVKRSNASRSDIVELLISLLLIALEESPMRSDDEDMAILADATQHAGPAFDVETPRTRALCLAITGISKNVALQIFVKLLLASIETSGKASRGNLESPEALGLLYSAVNIGDTGLARRALLQYVHRPDEPAGL